MVLDTHNQAGGRGATRRGFSLMDLLVSIAVIAILIAVLTPALGTAMESARRVKCKAQLYQIGTGIHGYLADNAEMLPPTVHATATTYNGVRYPRFEQSIYLRLEQTSPRLRRSNGWDGLGHLFHSDRQAGYLSTPEVMYCPSHSGDHKFEDYSDAWLAQDSIIGGNYQYRLPIYATRAVELDQALALVSDGLREKSDYNHRIGNNLLKADISVSWFDDDSGKVLDELVDDGDHPDARIAVAQAWGHLDLDPRRPVSSPPVRRDHHEDGIFAGIGGGHASRR